MISPPLVLGRLEVGTVVARMLRDCSSAGESAALEDAEAAGSSPASPTINSHPRGCPSAVGGVWIFQSLRID